MKPEDAFGKEMQDMTSKFGTQLVEELSRQNKIMREALATIRLARNSHRDMFAFCQNTARIALEQVGRSEPTTGSEGK